MFWDATYSPSPKIEALLNKENCTLSELLDDEEILQECKSQNTKLVQFLNRPDVLEELVTLITTEPPPNAVETLRFKHSNIACEILTSDLPLLNRSIVADPNVLTKLYSFLEQEPPLNPLLMSFFTKTFGMLWAQKQKQDWFTYQFVCVTVLEFLKSRDNFLDTLLRHVYTPVILDLLYHIVTEVEGPDLRKTLFDWLMEQRLVEKLVAVLGDERDADKHMNVAQFIVEYLSAGRTKRQSEKQESGAGDPILEALESKATMQLLLENMLKVRQQAGESEGDSAATTVVSSSAIVAGTKIILALFEENLISDSCDDPALQFLVNAEKEHHQLVVSNLIEIMRQYVDKFHDLLLVEPKQLLQAMGIAVVGSGETESGIGSDMEEKEDPKLAESQLSSVEEVNVDATDAAAPAETEFTEASVVGEPPGASADDSGGTKEDVIEDGSAKGVEEASKDVPVEATSPAADTAASTEGEADVEQGPTPVISKENEMPLAVVAAKRNNFTRSKAFGNTRLQICCLFTVLLETENSDIIDTICASNFFKTLLNLFKQFCWNNFLHSQVKKCLVYAIAAYDEAKDDAGNIKLSISPLQRHLITDCCLAPTLIECWQTNEQEQMQQNGHRLGYMGHLISILDTLVSNYKLSDELRALVDESLANGSSWTATTASAATATSNSSNINSNNTVNNGNAEAAESSAIATTSGDDQTLMALWTKITGEGGALEQELEKQKTYLADYNPFKVTECEPKDFYNDHADTFQELEVNTLSENLDNFLSRYISSDLNSRFFTTMNGWTLDNNLDEFDTEMNWPKFDAAETSGNGQETANVLGLNFASPWDEDSEGGDSGMSPNGGDEESANDNEDQPQGSGVAAGQMDSGWANFSSANFADFDSHFTIDMFDVNASSAKDAASGGGTSIGANINLNSNNYNVSNNSNTTTTTNDGEDADECNAKSNDLNAKNQTMLPEVTHEVSGDSHKGAEAGIAETASNETSVAKDEATMGSGGGVVANAGVTDPATASAAEKSGDGHAIASVLKEEAT